MESPLAFFDQIDADKTVEFVFGMVFIFWSLIFGIFLPSAPLQTH